MNPIDWFYAKGDKHAGPVNSAELKRLATAGELKPDDLVWREGMADWTVARNVRGLFEEEAKPAGTAGQGAPPKVAEPITVTTANAAPSVSNSTTFAATSPQVQKTQPASKHLFDMVLNVVRTQFPATFVESTTKGFVTLGTIGLWTAMGLSVVYGLAVAVKEQTHEALVAGCIYFVVLAVLQFVGTRFCELLVRLNRSTGANVRSTALPDCLALLGIALGAASLIGTLVPAVIEREFWWILPGLAGFVIGAYLAFIALNLNTINVNLVAESSASEEAIGLISFVAKTAVKLVPVVFGSVAVVGGLLLLYACVEVFASEPKLADALASDAWYLLVRSAALPLVAFLAFLLIWLMLDIFRAILVLPSKLEKPQNQEVK